jgi:hypothetical protein
MTPVLSLIVTVALMTLGTVILSLRDETTLGLADLADVLWRNLATAALLGAFGVCIGGIVRNQIVAIVGLALSDPGLPTTVRTFRAWKADRVALTPST